MNPSGQSRQPQLMSRVRRLFGIGAVCVIVLGGCGGGSDDEATPDGETGVETTDGGDGGNGGVEADNEAEAVSTDDDIEGCALFTADDFEAVTGVAGEATEGLATLPQGVLGICDYKAADIVPMISVTFHEASNWDDFRGQIESSGIETLPADGGETFVSDDLGLFFKPDGGSWYIQVLAMPGPESGLDMGAYSSDLALEVVDVVMAKA